MLRDVTLDDVKADTIAMYTSIQLFRERLSDKVHATTRKVLWVVLSSLFFKEIWKKGRRGRGHMSASAKGKQQK